MTENRAEKKSPAVHLEGLTSEEERMQSVITTRPTDTEKSGYGCAADAGRLPGARPGAGVFHRPQHTPAFLPET